MSAFDDLKEQTKGLPWVLEPKNKQLQLPPDPTILPMAKIRSLLFQFTEMFRWTCQALAKKRAELKTTKVGFKNEVRMRQVQEGKSFAHVERIVKSENADLVEQLAILEAEIDLYSGLCDGFMAGKEVLSREITIRVKE